MDIIHRLYRYIVGSSEPVIEIQDSQDSDEQQRNRQEERMDQLNSYRAYMNQLGLDLGWTPEETYEQKTE